MKKITYCLLCCLLISSLTGCGKSEAAQTVDDKIKAIGEVTIDSMDLITDARNSYDALPEEDKQDIENYNQLVAAEESYTGVIISKLSSDTWQNVNDGDVYEFSDDYSGKHDETTLTYSYENDIITVTEGAGASFTKSFTWDRSGTIDKLIPDGENTYYVQSANYSEISKQIRAEYITILTTEGMWKPTNAMAVMTFANNGTGYLAITGSTTQTKWSFVDNNTIKITVNSDGNKILTVDIINDNGNYSLVSQDGTVTYLPYKQ